MVKSLNKAYSHENGAIFHYYCNSCGDINIPGQDPLYCGKPEELPVQARELYEKFWSETGGANCYVVQYNNQFGIALGGLMPGDEETKELLRENKCPALPPEKRRVLMADAVRKAAELLDDKVNPDGIVFFGEDTDPAGDEILIFVPDTRLTSEEAGLNGLSHAAGVSRGRLLCLPLCSLQRVAPTRRRKPCSTPNSPKP